MALVPNTPTTPRFASILAARGNDGRPSDMEFMLRQYCRKIKVVDKLSGAHLLMSSSSSSSSSSTSLEQSSLAIRVYYDCDLPELSNNDDSIDNLASFFQSFQFTAVFLVLKPQEQRLQLDRPDSLLHRVQRLANKVPQQQAQQNKVIRIFMLPDTTTAIDSLLRLCDALNEQAPDRRHWYHEQSQLLFAQPSSSSSSSAAHAARHVADAIRDWAARFELVDGEANVLMSLLGSVRAIATASHDDLRRLPLEERTLRLVHAFFGTAPARPMADAAAAGGGQESVPKRSHSVVPYNPMAITEHNQQEPPPLPPQHDSTYPWTATGTPGRGDWPLQRQQQQQQQQQVQQQEFYPHGYPEQPAFDQRTKLEQHTSSFLQDHNPYFGGPEQRYPAAQGHPFVTPFTSRCDKQNNRENLRPQFNAPPHGNHPGLMTSMVSRHTASPYPHRPPPFATRETHAAPPFLQYGGPSQRSMTPQPAPAFREDHGGGYNNSNMMVHPHHHYQQQQQQQQHHQRPGPPPRPMMQSYHHQPQIHAAPMRHSTNATFSNTSNQARRRPNNYYY